MSEEGKGSIALLVSENEYFRTRITKTHSLLEGSQLYFFFLSKGGFHVIELIQQHLGHTHFTSNVSRSTIFQSLTEYYSLCVII
jgi:hypothetical protein